MVKDIYENFECGVQDQGKKCTCFRIKRGVKQGCNISVFLFLIVMDWIMRKSAGHAEYGIRWKFTSKVGYLDFAGDIMLLSSRKINAKNQEPQ